MLWVIGRALSFGLPWLVVMAISVTIAYGMSLALTGGASTTTRGDASVRIATDRPVGGAAAGGEGWVVYLGNNCWIPDPREQCASKTAPRH